MNKLKNQENFNISEGNVKEDNISMTEYLQEEAVIARDEYLKEHPELKIRGLEKRDE